MAKGIRTAITARRAAAIAIAGAAAATLSACGAGQETQTDLKVSAIAGVNVDEGDLALRDLQVEFDSAEGYAVGDDAALRVWIGNEGTEEVSLTGVAVFASEDEAAQGAAEVGTVTYVDPAAPVEEPTESPGGATPTGEDGQTDGTETASEAPSPQEPEFEGDTAIDIAIAPSEYARLDQAVENGPYLLVEDLAVDLPVGSTIWVVFEFSDGSTAEAALPTGQDVTGEEEREYYEPEEPAEGH
ncbi:hypothetical protein GCM10009830_24130 [Glycomyces endophyticus]|uniref:Copper chaperone PCu(A)C n=1 Tax=Glycomyces endophyticus TaxID=480996 RepID=A0ABN2GTJ7_9ACTN